ncbi:putative glycerol-3-phosphate transporter 5 [Dendrobium catenatum]|uniref:Glycerol-3-phosphate transporter 5 n=1 Tax=Dendrobium catenatum TaxID=906689 RepID=A0A2I0VQ31_9ASPA|nr:putative glycerol-3-phosphate transporter 5 [Dendrobium catenatum]PKU65493.1 Putative glycerol-3-phosphate transporter 5 [Dendrobium catenatum]
MDGSGPVPPAPPLSRRSHRLQQHQIRSLLLTFLAYSAFHASRKPPSIVKSVLAPDPTNSTSSSAAGWHPFDGNRGPHRLGELDLAFLSAYSAGMYLSGHAADRLDLRRFLAGGMFGSCIATAAFGFAYWLDVHRLWFFVLVQVAGGFLQSIGWPCVVAVVTNWFGDSSRRGLIMGIWNSNTSVGNILGSVLASCVLNFGWGWSFIVPALVIGLVGVLVFACLVPHPRDLALENMECGVELNVAIDSFAVNDDGLVESLNGKNSLISDETALLQRGLTEGKSCRGTEGEEEPIGFFEAWRLPSVASYACCLFFSKLVAYTFLYWLPFYIRHTAVSGEHLTHRTSGILSTVFDIGGVLGGVSAGFISDWLCARAITSVMFLILSVPSLILYRMYGGISLHFNIGLMFLSGFFVNGPYSLITTAVSADLGTQGLIKGNSRALATITAIIDGTGSIGAALGPLLTGYISTWGWNNVFLMLILSNSLAVMCLTHIAKAEITSKKKQQVSSTIIDAESW